MFVIPLTVDASPLLGPCPAGFVAKAASGLAIVLPIWGLGILIAIGAVVAFRLGRMAASKAAATAGLSLVGFFLVGAMFFTNCLVCVPEAEKDDIVWSCAKSESAPVALVESLAPKR